MQSALKETRLGSEKKLCLGGRVLDEGVGVRVNGNKNKVMKCTRRVAGRKMNVPSTRYHIPGSCDDL